MGKLNIAHHKSYHPYRRDNIERVRRDEEEARQKEAKEEGRMLLADSEARLDQLRERAGIGSSSEKKKQKEEDLDKIIAAGSVTHRAVLPTTGGHINFFEDLEQTSLAAAIKATTKKPAAAETEKGVPLAPSAKDLKPWYTDRHRDQDEEPADERRMRDTARKSIHDPLTSINQQLSKGSSSSSSSMNSSRRRPHEQSSMGPPEVNERIKRESSERERALALIRRKKREMAGSETPSTVHGGLDDDGAPDLFNRREVEEARKHRERRWEHHPRQRGWRR